MVDTGAGLNICNLKLVTTLGFFEACIDTYNKIIIKDYDDVEHSSIGIITLLVRVEPTIHNTIFQVLDISLPYNLHLVRPWIYSMRVIPSMYHQFLKFPYNHTEITISGNTLSNIAVVWKGPLSTKCLLIGKLLHLPHHITLILHP